MKTPLLQPYLTLGGRAEEAIEFYKNVFDAEIEMVMYFDQSPDPLPEGMLPEGFEKKVMHASFLIGDQRVMLSDGSEERAVNHEGCSLSLTLDSEDDIRRIYSALAEGGKKKMPLDKTFWSPLFGMVQDKFGIHWMLTLPTSEEEF